MACWFLTPDGLLAFLAEIILAVASGSAGKVTAATERGIVIIRKRR
jgi:hypothetical protein